MEFLNRKKVAKLIRRYSEFIDFPIYLHEEKEVEEEVVAEDKVEEGSDDLEVKEKTEETKEKVKRKVWDW